MAAHYNGKSSILCSLNAYIHILRNVFKLLLVSSFLISRIVRITQPNLLCFVLKMQCKLLVLEHMKCNRSSLFRVYVQMHMFVILVLFMCTSLMVDG
jgi:hypothetical protein